MLCSAEHDYISWFYFVAVQAMFWHNSSYIYVVDDALDAFAEEGTTGGEVDADVAFARGFTIHGAGVDKDLGVAK